MSAFFDLHVHTEFCDGKSTAEEMVEAAIALGCPKIGLSTHSPLAYPSYAMKPEREDDYRAEIARLKEKYRDKIQVLCGLEVDLYGLPVTKEYDYIIASCHSLSPLGEDGRRTDVDGPLDALKAAIDTHFGGDPYAACEDYFAGVARLGERNPSIIGHFDLIRKYNRGAALFDENHPRYLAAARAAVDALLPLGVPFEVNTGAVARGYRETPYPAAPILAYILSHGGKVILTGDTHKKENLCFQFARWAEYVRMFG
jgi:histidinol-phosphatase (PHP family)